MREPGDCLRLALEAGEGARVIRDGLGEDLDRNVAPEPRVACTLHLTHAAGAERRDDLVGAEAGARLQRHRAPSTTKSCDGILT